ncbi:hypothetical protein L6164_001899 [Bauhinia variegata]|uniref:Uncharacterized protein n=1 Tax=Bauhinia variegata TaxID=167791 RepID=A0ACB9QB05_BAUVA|nr:hypothetical protein L6164_001899 [Bauhinia variegata]
MKAPGRDYRIYRDDFERDPSAYFRSLREEQASWITFPVLASNTRAEDINQHDYLNREDQVEDKGISDKGVSGGAKDVEKDAHNVDTSDSDTSSAKGKNVIDHIDNGDLAKSHEHVKKVGVGETPEDEKVETVQRRKRKRTIMNDKQISLIERALLDEPDMQRNATSLQSWADKLSLHGSEVISSQLKNWLNNRKARLARTARDVRTVVDADNPGMDKQRGAVLGSFDSPDSPIDASNARKDLQNLSRRTSGDIPEPSLAELVDLSSTEFDQRKAGQHVVLVDKRGEEIGKGKVFQAHGKWHGKNLEELEACVVDVSELKADKGLSLPYPSEGTGNSFAEAETKLGVMRVLWDNRIFVVRSE